VPTTTLVPIPPAVSNAVVGVWLVDPFAAARLLIVRLRDTAVPDARLVHAAPPTASPHFSHVDRLAYWTR
jgi:hypothetical protein